MTPVEIADKHGTSWHWVEVGTEGEEVYVNLDGQFSIGELSLLIDDLVPLAKELEGGDGRQQQPA